MSYWFSTSNCMYVLPDAFKLHIMKCSISMHNIVSYMHSLNYLLRHSYTWRIKTTSIIIYKYVLVTCTLSEYLDNCLLFFTNNLKPWKFCLYPITHLIQTTVDSHYTKLLRLIHCPVKSTSSLAISVFTKTRVYCIIAKHFNRPQIWCLNFIILKMTVHSF